jgi:hypothetical protein
MRLTSPSDINVISKEVDFKRRLKLEVWWIERRLQCDWVEGETYKEYLCYEDEDVVNTILSIYREMGWFVEISYTAYNSCFVKIRFYQAKIVETSKPKVLALEDKRPWYKKFF